MTSRSRHGPPPLPGASDDASGKSSDAATSETTAVAGSTRAPGASHCSSTSESGMSVRSMRTAASAIRPGAPGARALLSSPGSGIPGSLLTSSTSESDTRSTQSPGESMGSYKRPGQAGHSRLTAQNHCRPFSGKEGGRIKMRIACSFAAGARIDLHTAFACPEHESLSAMLASFVPMLSRRGVVSRVLAQALVQGRRRWLAAKGIPIVMPALSPTMTSGKIVKWSKKEGDQ